MRILRRIVVWGGGLSLVLGAVGLVTVWWVGAWNLVFPNHTHETVAPSLPAVMARPAFLLFTKTNGFRHSDAIAAGGELFEEMAQRRGWSVFRTENGAVFNDADLARFDAVVFHNASGDMLDAKQEASFQRFLENGGGWLGTHAAGDGSHEEWDWYVDAVIGAPYNAHIMGPQFQEARVVVEDPDHPATRHLPAEFQHSEEWYSWSGNPRDAGVRVLVTVDESTYSPWAKFLGSETDLRMGDHPVVWTRCVGAGRTMYSALGHAGEAYELPEVRNLLEGGLAWVLRQEGSGCD